MSIKSVFESVEDLKSALENLSVEALEARLTDESLLLVDVREIQEQVDHGTIPGSRLVPRGMLEFWADPQSPYYRDFFVSDKQIVLFCARGQRSALAARALLDMGYANVAHLEHGFHGWSQAGRPIEDVASRSRWMRKPKASVDRDVDKEVTPAYFVDVLRRLADAVEGDEPFRIQVAGTRFTVPSSANVSIEHEASKGEHELEFQLKWREG